ncbi:MAG: YcgN family cysteine cluster protein [Firmicutes bacterium]|nr:YcgN family cysteine cluster protein [Bacillota bacterium]
MTKKLSDYKPEEWEAVCNRCGKCCLIKLQDDDTEEIYYTDVVCRYFDEQSCTCTRYDERCKLVPECLKLTPENLDKIDWMPQTCAYRALLNGQPKPPRNPITGRCVSELDVSEEELEDHIVDWEDL